MPRRSTTLTNQITQNNYRFTSNTKLFLFNVEINSFYRKRKSTDKDKILEKIAKVEKPMDVPQSDFKKGESVPLTKAEKAFLKMKEKKVKLYFIV